MYGRDVLILRWFVDIIQGIDPEKPTLLEKPERRDPDALPPGNGLEALGNIVYHAVSALGRGNAVFGLKAGLLSGKGVISLSVRSQ